MSPLCDSRPVRVLGVSASCRSGSATTAAVRIVLDAAKDCGAEVNHLELSILDLPFCNGDKSEPWPTRPGVRTLREAMRTADAAVLATPEYHGGMSGMLKNALDLLDFEHTEGKVFAGISALGGRPNSNALNDLRNVARWLRAWMLVDQVAIPAGRTAFVAGHPRDPDVLQRLTDLAASLVRHTALLRGLDPAPARPGSLFRTAKCGVDDLAIVEAAMHTPPSARRAGRTA
ncbi:MAG: NADPH-dependent FMN reductase [Pseudonocardiaceae bacterium]